MPPDPTSKSRKRSLTPRRGAIACVRCKERKAKCTPAPPGASRLPTCMNCLNARASCVYLDRTPNEIFLLEYVSQLEARVATLEMELSKYNPSSSYTSDHSTSLQAAAVDALTQQYPQGPYVAERSPSSEAGQRSNSRPRPVTDDENDELALGVGMLSLSGLGDPLYLGASSGVNWARVCATALRRPDTITTAQGRFAFQAPPHSASAESALSYGIENPIPPLPPPHLADQYFELVYNHVQAQYSFLDWHALQAWHRDRDDICMNRPLVGSGQGTDHARGLAAFMLWLVYGYGARLMEERKIEGAVSHEVYYSAAVSCLSTLTSHHSLATVQCLLLLETYSIWHARSEISTWQVAGLALRTAIELGLHRRTRSRSEREKDPLRYEMKKRVFWTVYTMDRMIALQLGRPSGIADKDIDIEFPLNIDLQVTDPKHIFEMQNRQIEITKDKYSGAEYTKGYDQVNSMTSSIHNIRLNQLKQLIQDTIYRLDKPQRDQNDGQGLSDSQPIPEVEAVLHKLNEWRACRPIQPTNAKPLPLLSEEQLGLDYHECVQMLLRPTIAIRKAATYYAPLCAESAACCCEIDVFAPNTPSLRLVTFQLYRLFLSGLTLLHLISSPTTQHCIHHDRAANALHRSLNTIGHLVKMFPGAAPYEAVLSELVRGWDSKRHEHINFHAQQPDFHSSSRHKVKTSPDHENGGLPGTMNPSNLDMENRHMNWGMPPPQASHDHVSHSSSHAQQAPLDNDWMAALLENNSFGQGSGDTILTTPQHHASGSGSHGHAHGHEHGQNGQQTLTEDLGTSWTPLFGSPRSTEAFSDQWGGTLLQMGGQVTGPVRDDFFSLLSSFGLETIVESANEASQPVNDGPIWQPPGLDNLILGNHQPVQQPAMPDFTTMGMGEFLDWSQRTGRTGQYEAYTAQPQPQQEQEQQRGRRWAQ